jgi:hypothetical protein
MPKPTNVAPTTTVMVPIRSAVLSMQFGGSRARLGFVGHAGNMQ